MLEASVGLVWKVKFLIGWLLILLLAECVVR